MHHSHPLKTNGVAWIECAGDVTHALLILSQTNRLCTGELSLQVFLMSRQSTSDLCILTYCSSKWRLDVQGLMGHSKGPLSPNLWPSSKALKHLWV